MSNNHHDESFNAEEIIALRMQLYRTRQQLQAFENSHQLKDIYQKLIAKMIQIVSSRSRSVIEIAHNLKITSDVKIKNNFEFKLIQEEGENAFISKCESILRQFAGEQQILNKITCVIPQLKRQNEQMKQEIQNLRKQYAKFQQKSGKVQIDSKKIKQLQLQLQDKSISLSKIQFMNKQYEEKIKKMSKQLQQAHQNIENLQKQRQFFDKNAKAHKISHERLQQNNQQRQKAINNCQKLLQMINIPNQEYLKHYFRNSGLQFSAQTTRKQKNKYSLVFDN